MSFTNYSGHSGRLTNDRWLTNRFNHRFGKSRKRINPPDSGNGNTEAKGKDENPDSWEKSFHWFLLDAAGTNLFPNLSNLNSSLCNLCVLCVSVVIFTKQSLTTETQRTQR